MGLAQITRRNLLVVEGKSALVFFEAFLAHLGRTNDVQVQDFGSRDNRAAMIRTLAVTPGFAGVNSFGIVIDAEGNPSGTLQSLRHHLGRASLAIPPGHAQFVSGKPRVGFFILPDGISEGMLETLCLRAVAADPAMPCIDEFFNCLTLRGVPAPQNPTKARTQAFLASRVSSKVDQVGRAAQASIWPWASDAFAEARQFLSDLVHSSE